MKSIETRRISRIAHFTMIAVGALVLFEAAMLGGIVDLRSSWVARHAPWAYEPFLRLVGEHPDSPWAVRPEQEKSAAASSVSDMVLPAKTDAVPEAVQQGEPEPVTEADDDIPVG